MQEKYLEKPWTLHKITIGRTLGIDNVLKNKKYLESSKIEGKHKAWLLHRAMKQNKVKSGKNG